jgi:hypothetical protein
MTVTVENLREEVNTTEADNTLLERCLDLAVQLVTKHLVDNLEDEEIDEIPPVILDQATLATAVDAFNQSKAPNGILNQQFDTVEGGVQSVPIRISADPMRPAYPLLDKWLTPVVGGASA